MPITQQRFLTMISTARQLYDSLEQMREQVIGAAQELSKPEPNIKELRDRLSVMGYALTIPGHLSGNLFAEERYFKRMANRNDRERERHERRRKRERGEEVRESLKTGGLNEKFKSPDELGRMLDNATPQDFAAYRKFNQDGPPPPEALPGDANQITLAAPEGVKHTITQGKKGEIIEREVKFATGPGMDADGAPQAATFEPGEEVL